MPRGPAHPPEIRARALRLYLEGDIPPNEIARRLGLPLNTVQSWIFRRKRMHDSMPPDALPQRFIEEFAHYTDDRGSEQIGQLLYDTVVDSLNALRARARATADPEWIKAQSADQIAELTAVQGDWVLRVLSAFRPENTAAEIVEAEESGAEPHAESEVHRNGAVDSAG